MGDGFYRSEDQTNSIKLLKDTQNTQLIEKIQEAFNKHKTQQIPSLQ